MTGKLEFFPRGAWTFKKRQSSWPDTVWYSKFHLCEWWYSLMRIDRCLHCYIYHVIPRSLVWFYRSGLLLRYWRWLTLWWSSWAIQSSIIIFAISSLSDGEFDWELPQFAHLTSTCPTSACMDWEFGWPSVVSSKNLCMPRQGSGRLICKFQKVHFIPGDLSRYLISIFHENPQHTISVLYPLTWIYTCA